MGLCINSGPKWEDDSLNKKELHWACKVCIVGMMNCDKPCYRLRLPHPYCDEICKTSLQEMCTSRINGYVTSCIKVNRLRMKRGTWHGSAKK